MLSQKEENIEKSLESLHQVGKESLKKQMDLLSIQDKKNLEEILQNIHKSKKYGQLRLTDLKSFEFLEFFYRAKNKDGKDISLQIFQIDEINMKYIPLWKKIKIPFILELYDSYTIKVGSNEYAILEFELYEYNLKEMIQDQKYSLDEENKQWITRQLIYSVNYLHSLNIVHCDISPTNILIKIQGRQLICKLEEMQINLNSQKKAQIIQTLFINKFIGSIFFLSPDNIRRIEENNDDLFFSKQTDIFSLGKILCVFESPQYFIQNLTFLSGIIKDQFENVFKNLKLSNNSWIYHYIQQFCIEEIKNIKPLQSVIDANLDNFLELEAEVEEYKKIKNQFFRNEILQSITFQGEQVELDYGKSHVESYIFIQNQQQPEEYKQDGQSYKQRITKKQLEDKIKRHCELLNPHVNNIEQEDISFTYDYFFFDKQNNQDAQKQNLLEENTTRIINEIQQKVKSLDQSKLIQAQKLEDQQLILKGVLFTYLRNEGHQVQLCDSQDSQEDIENFYQALSLLKSQANQAKYYELTIPDSDEFSYERVMSSQNNMNEFIQTFISAASQIYQVPEKSIHIMNIRKGSIKINYQIKEQVNAYLDFIKTKLSDVFRNLTLALKSLLSNSVIKDTFFDPQHNYFWDEAHLKIQTSRGSLSIVGQKKQRKVYYFPINYLGFGIDIQKHQISNKEWLTKGNNAWIVLYHGTGLQGYQGITETYIQPGVKNYYGNKNFTCRITQKSIKAGQNANTYLSDLATLSSYKAKQNDTAENYCKPIEFCGKKVNPNYVKSPKGKEHFFAVEAQYAKENIIYYRVLLKEV